MAKFCELGVESDSIIGKGIEIEELFGRRVLIEKVLIQPTKFPGKNSSGLRMQMQVVLATFNEAADKDGDFFTKNPDGTPIGERRSCFTGSDILIGAIQKAETNLPIINKGRTEKGLPPIKLFPMDTTIVKVGKCFQFT
ncbi:MAG: hypothetical protein IAC06_06050 [Bacteroidetes bacterium]|uniref:Uncharacterized protein n=1 Tax=Candidatus Cryptobacteroides intestinavium TaxID=2840766 RepID=A0A9D9EQX4_9BACT|nr:hypothetical protein [Candidatus Cryptobacteroides intestinavium]